MRRRRRLRDMLAGGDYARSVSDLHGLKRNSVKSAYYCGWKRQVDSYSGGGINTLTDDKFRKIGIDIRIEGFHGYHSRVNKKFRKIEP